MAFLPVGAVVHADSPKPFADFKPKFVKPPKAGERKRVNVKINRPAVNVTPPVAAESAVAAAPSGEIARPKAGQYDWFWDKVSPGLALAVISVESSGRTDAVSSAGAQGLMQLMPDTASRFGVVDSSVTQQNISGGVKYLDWLMGEFANDPILVLAGYNAGEGSVRKHAGVPPFAETRDYVPKVLAAFQVAKGLCKTPPELISDGCVFNLMK
ncbi:MAG: lytic transglycosylase domain-containing protein [Sulfitobacter sp.]|nr:lytic transglycosylase domain-containing protein [Sulfitobacter sp.]